jgi:hypothetical protein
MGRVIGLSLCESIPLGIALNSSFYKLLAAESLFADYPCLVSLHRAN